MDCCFSLTASSDGIKNNTVVLTVCAGCDHWLTCVNCTVMKCINAGAQWSKVWEENNSAKAKQWDTSHKKSLLSPGWSEVSGACPPASAPVRAAHDSCAVHIWSVYIWKWPRSTLHLAIAVVVKWFSKVWKHHCTDYSPFTHRWKAGPVMVSEREEIKASRWASGTTWDGVNSLNWYYLSTLALQQTQVRRIWKGNIPLLRRNSGWGEFILTVFTVFWWLEATPALHFQFPTLVTPDPSACFLETYAVGGVNVQARGVKLHFSGAAFTSR